MKKHIAKAYVEKSEEKEGILRLAIASTGDKDRHGETIDPKGWKIESFLKNPVFQWAHDITKPPIGKVIDLVVGDKLKFAVKFDMEDSFAAEIYRKYVDGFLNAFSVGFMPIKFGNEDQGEFTFVEQELFEISAVPVPANAEALVQIRSKGMEPMDWSDVEEKATKEAKAVVKYEETDPSPETTEWNPSEAEKRIEKWATEEDEMNWTKYRRAFTYHDPSNAEDKSGYQLLHHDVVGEKIVTVWQGVASAMAKLIGEDVDIPEEDRKSVYNHLKKHYKQYGKEAPEFRSVQEIVERYVSGEGNTKVEVSVDEKTLKDVVARTVQSIVDKEKNKKTVIKKGDAFTQEDFIQAVKAVDLAVEKVLQISKAK